MAAHATLTLTLPLPSRVCGPSQLASGAPFKVLIGARSTLSANQDKSFCFAFGTPAAGLDNAECSPPNPPPPL